MGLATLGKDHEVALGSMEAYADFFFIEQHEHDTAQSVLLDCIKRRDPVAFVRGQEFTVERSSGALESDWRLEFGAQVYVKIQGIGRLLGLCLWSDS